MKVYIKNQEQIQKMRIGGSILRKTLAELALHVKPGVTTLELDQIAESFIRSFDGAQPAFKGYDGFPGTLCTSVNDEVVHTPPSSSVILQSGDIVSVDCGVLYGELYTDACYTFTVGEVGSETKYFLKTTKKALDIALKKVKAGIKTGDLSAVIQKTIEDQGYSPVAECTGHGVGLDLHEFPEIPNVGQKNEGDVLEAGMTVAIEPIANMGNGDVYTDDDNWTIRSADGSLSAHFEHTVLITSDGCEILT